MEFNWKELAAELESGRAAALCTIIERHGSVPREVGARMLVREDGSISGTIGGGIGEHEVIRSARQSLAEGRSRILEYSLAGEQGLDSPAICGGRFSILIDFWSPAKELALARLLAASMSDGKLNFLLVSHPGKDQGTCRHALYDTGGRKLGGAGSLPERLEIPGDSRENETISKLSDGQTDGFLSRLTPPPRMIIFGGGHLALPLCEIAAWCRFAVTVIDDRPEFSRPERFPAADRVLTAPMEDVSGLFVPSPNLWHVLITREHKHDYTLLRQLLGTEYAYLGMIGSRRRTTKVKQRLLDEGFNAAEIDRLHSPIGLGIGAQTPAEIAVSIMAEIIAVRHGADEKLKPGA